MKNKYKISSDLAPKAIGSYSQAIGVNNFIFTSGQIPINPKTGNIISNNFRDQALQCLENIEGILIHESLSIKQIIKLTVYLVDLSNFDVLNETFNEFFKGDFPARSVVEVSRLPKDSQIEIEAICYNAD